MAERRMFAKTIIDSDAFLDMPLSSQALYFHLSMRADDEGFINNPKKVMRMINASNNDMDLLTAKKFIIPFESGVVVIKHWKIHNYIQRDRFHPTKYQEEKALLVEKENGAYTLDTRWIQDGNNSVYKVDTEDRLGKDRLGKRERGRFTPPTLAEVQAYKHERNSKVDPERFMDYYTANGWKVGGRSAMKDWKAAFRNWEKREGDFSPQKKQETQYDRYMALLEKEDGDDIRGNGEVFSMAESDFQINED